MSKRRGKGEGSIYKRKDGLWVGQYKVHTQQGARTKYVYSKTRKEAAAKLAIAIADRDSGIIFDSGSLKVEKYLQGWLDSVRDTVKDRTWQRCEEIVRLHLTPILGNLRLDRISALHIQSLYRTKLASGLPPRTVQIIHTTLHKALKQAVKWSLIPRNVTEAVDPPQSPRKEIRPLSEEQVKVLLEAAQGTELYALYVLAVTTGMRRGELLGLKWEDLDLQAETIQVKRTVFNGKIGTPKTSKGRRSIKLTQEAIRTLQNHQRRGEWILSSRVGTSISCHNLINRSWKPLLGKADLPYTNFHTLRHTAATLLLTKGFTPK